MSTPDSGYGRARLWVGITSVGTHVMLACAILALFAFGVTLPVDLPPIAVFYTIILLFTLAAFPFDLLGGYYLPVRYGRACPTFTGWLLGWLRGVGVLQLLWLLSATAIYGSGYLGGLPLALIVNVVIVVIFIHYQLFIARLVTPLGISTHASYPGIIFASTPDPDFTGGIVGLPGRERIVLPLSWLHRFPSLLPLVIARRGAAISSRLRSRGLLLAVLWGSMGLCCASLAPGAGFANPTQFVALILYFVVWSFIGLLVLPSFSRGAVLALDAALVRAGASPAEMSTLLHTLEPPGEPTRHPTVERIFYPIPALSARLAALQAPATGQVVGGWHTARYALYLSIPTLGLLSRAVHCNSGSPALWVLLPSD